MAFTFDPHADPSLQLDYPYFQPPAPAAFDADAGYSPVNAWLLAEVALLASAHRTLSPPSSRPRAARRRSPSSCRGIWDTTL
jgi:hypothetical protein